MRLLKRGRGLARNRRGATAITFALCLIPILMMSGFAIDFALHLTYKKKVQHALDMAGLAAARHLSQDAGADLDTIKRLARSHFQSELGDAGYISLNQVDVTRAGMRINLEVDGTMPTSIMHLAGVPTMSLFTESEAAYGIPTKIEVALVLDTSSSMSTTDAGQPKSRIASLKFAATEMVNTLMVGPDATIPVKMAVVPFSNRVNVGTDKAGKSWLSVPADFTKTEQNCHIPIEWYELNCTENSYTCDDDGVDDSCRSFDCPAGAEDAAIPVCTTESTDYSWNGCVQPRTEAYHLTDGNYGSEKIPGYLSVHIIGGVSDKECASKIQKMTSDPSRVKRGINNMQVRSDTYMPSGLIWGYRMLTGQAPFRANQSISAFMRDGGAKAIVLMSDGSNTLAPEPDGSISGDDISAADPNTTEVCNLIKAANVEIYVVAYDISDVATTALLEDCASSTSRFFTATSTDQLEAVFATITKQLGRDVSISG